MPQARSIAVHTASARFLWPRMDCSVATEEMAIGWRRYSSLHLGGCAAEDALAQQGVGLDAAHAAALEALRRCPARLVVHDDQAPVWRQVEPVDDAAQPHAVDQRLDAELQPDRMGLVGVLKPEVVVDQGPGVGEEGVSRLRVELELYELVVVLQFVP